MSQNSNKPMFHFSFVSEENPIQPIPTEPPMETTSQDTAGSIHSAKNSVLDPSNPMVSHKESYRGLYLPQDVLDKYTRQFYSMNGGVEQMKLDRDTDTRDSASQWDEERKALTMDWKRKHRNAVARKKAHSLYRV
jgi:hypothetical protein